MIAWQAAAASPILSYPLPLGETRTPTKRQVEIANPPFGSRPCSGVRQARMPWLLDARTLFSVGRSDVSCHSISVSVL